MSFAQGAPTQPLVFQGSNVFLYGSSTAGNAFTVQQQSAGNVASFVTSTGATGLIVNPTGLVGIGTTNPGAPLQVNTTNTGTTPGLALYYPALPSTGGNSVGAFVGTAAAASQTGYIQFQNYGGNAANTFNVGMFGGVQMCINTTGVGIGTTNAGALLHVTGPAASTVSNIVVEAGTNAIGQRSEIRFGIPAFSGTGKRAGITSNTYVSDGSDLQFWTNATSGTESAPRMTILQSGFIGIGTTNPQNTLHVSGGRTRLVAGSETYALGVSYSEASTGLYYIGATNSATPDMVFSQVGGSERMRITNGGNVGIGTNNPAYTLDIGQFGSSTYTLRLAAASTTAGTMGTSIRMMEANDTYGFSFQNLSGSRLGIFRHSASSTGSEILTIMRDNPYVGIGITNPGYPLVVYGSNTAYQFTISSYNTSLDFNCGTRFGTLSPGFTTIDPNGSSPQGLGIWDHLAINGTCAIGAGYAQTTPSPGNSLIVAGNIGVGTASPARRLHLYDAATSGGGPFVVDQFAASGFTDTVTLFRTAQAATSGLNMCVMQSSSGSNNLFYVRGDGYVWAANDITAFSDARVKTNLQKIERALDKVSNINGYTFTRTDYTSEDDKHKRHVGVIAQEIQKVLPELVHEDDKGMLSVAYGNMTALLIEALKEERAERLKVDESLRTTIERLARLEKLLLKE